jgi:threonyl-tRNA synthetase
MTKIDLTTEEGLETYRHSTSHIMAMAVKELFPSAKLAIGPSISDGFYYDFDLPQTITPSDLEKIELKMDEIIKKDIPFIREEIPKEKALQIFKNLNETYKLELINELPDGTISVYKNETFVDLCRGPHIEKTGDVKAFKLLDVAGAYWRGDEHNKMLQRIYGTAFPDKKQLEQHLRNLEEARKRDHRKLGKDLDLFSVNEQTGAGLILWHPKGSRIRLEIENFWRAQHLSNGYEIVYTPHIGRGTLWQTSGHLDFYKENMFAPMDVEGQDFYIKPMNCPFHIQMYKNSLHSYRDLPLRWAELGTVYRYEKSGVLHGLMRVRGFTQDDAHIICRPDQMPDEIRKVLRFCLDILGAFGFKEFNLYVATKPKEKSVGDEAMWKDAEDALLSAVKDERLKCEIDPGGGAFYGPKIDVKIKDALSREWQCSTIQFDFNLPERFDMTYIDQTGKKVRPYMIHRALLGSLERFFGVLIEHYSGALPLWLSPVQISVLTITSNQAEYAEKLKERFVSEGFRVEINTTPEKINAKIREAELSKIPYMAIIGDKEAASGTISIRKQRVGNLGTLTIEQFINNIKEEIKTKKSE